VEGCYLSGVDRPICYGDGLGGVATDCLVVDRAIGHIRVPCGQERHLAVWLHDQKGVTMMTDGIRDGRKTSCCDVFVPDAICFAAVAFDT